MVSVQAFGHVYSGCAAHAARMLSTRNPAARPRCGWRCSHVWLATNGVGFRVASARKNRSSPMARKTMAMPNSRPLPMFSRFSADQTSNPRPRAPITEARITRFRVSITTWFRPSSKLSRAAGMRTSHINCHGRHPAMMPKSMVSDGTWRSASSVTRTMGGMEKMTVATTPATGLTPNSTTMGTM